MLPTPYYSDDSVTLFCASNADVLPWLHEKCVDHVITDPPYAAQTHAGARRVITGGGSNGEHKHHLISGATTLLDFDAITLNELYDTFARLGYTTRRWLIATMDWRHYAELERLPPPFVRAVRFGVWRKRNGAPQFTGDRPGTGWECVGIFHRADVGRMAWNNGGNHAVWDVPKIENALNPTAKPPALVRAFIEQFTSPGDLILDPWCGTGTTLLQAKQSGRRAIGIERDERQCAELVKALCPTFGKPLQNRRAKDAPPVPMFDMEVA